MQSCQSIPELIDELGLEPLHQTTGNRLIGKELLGHPFGECLASQ